MLTTQRRNPLETRDLVLLGLLAATAFALGLWGIYRYGYMGQDYTANSNIIRDFPASFTFNLTNPPVFYGFGHLFYHYAGPQHWTELVALAFLITNTLGLWIFYLLIWQAISHRALRYTAALLVTFIPFRVIHTIVIAADVVSLPLFALIAWFTVRLFEDPRRFGSWLMLSLVLSFAMVSKYTFAALLPPVAVLLAIAMARRLPAGARLRWWLLAIPALALPSAIILLEVRESKKINGTTTSGHWLAKGEPSEMRWGDQLGLHARDPEIFSAPEYFRDTVFENRRYSYPALLHIGTFTDVENYAQDPGNAPLAWSQRTTEEFQRGRTAWSQRLQVWSVRWSLPLAVLMLAGTLCCGVLAVRSLLTGAVLVPDAVIVLTSLAAAFYALIFLSLHRVAGAYTSGYWGPRHVLPAMLVFCTLGVVLVDLATQRWEVSRPALRFLPGAFTGYSVVAALLWVGFLC